VSGVGGVSAVVSERATRFVEHAHRYSELGWALTHLDGKKPKPHGWESTPADSPELAAGKWSQWGERWNMGVVLGSSGLAVVEYDTRAARDKLAELLGGGRPETPTARTGSGRLHFYFRDPDVPHTTRAGLELRAGGHQCVVPPSEHPDTGEEYRWLQGLEPWAVELADVPQALLAYFAEGKPGGRAAPLPHELLEGERRTALLSLAGSMRRRGAGAGAIEAALREENAARCKPPLPDLEVEELARDTASRYPPADSERSSGVPSTPEASVHAALGASSGEGSRGSPPVSEFDSGTNGSALPERNESPPALPFALLSYTLANVPAEPVWAWDGYLAPGALTLLAGRPKVGKSTLVFALIDALAHGKNFLGRRTRSVGVLLLTEEREGTLAEEARRWELNGSIHVLMRHQAQGCRWADAVAQAVSYCRDHDLGVLVVDTFDKWTGLRGDAENNAGSVLEVLEPLQQAAAAGLVVLLVAHQRKSFGEYGEAVRGSNALAGGVDVVVELERAKQTLATGTSTRVLRAVSRYASTPEELVGELTDGGYDPRDTIAAEAEAERAQVLETLQALERELTAKELAGETSIGERNVRRHCEGLAEEGLALLRGKGVKGDPHRWIHSGSADSLVPESNSEALFDGEAT
jgi:hypothetical protein